MIVKRKEGKGENTVGMKERGRGGTETTLFCVVFVYWSYLFTNGRLFTTSVPKGTYPDLGNSLTFYYGAYGSWYGVSVALLSLQICTYRSRVKVFPSLYAYLPRLSGEIRLL